MTLTRRGLLWAVAALLGIAVTAALTWSVSRLAAEHIGLSSEPVSVIQGLAPPRREAHAGPVASNEHSSTTPARRGSTPTVALPSTPQPAAPATRPRHRRHRHRRLHRRPRRPRRPLRAQRAPAAITRTTPEAAARAGTTRGPTTESNGPGRDDGPGPPAMAAPDRLWVDLLVCPLVDDTNCGAWAPLGGSEQ